MDAAAEKIRIPPERVDPVVVQRRRAVLVEAGISHNELAKMLSRGRKRRLSRAGITNLLGGFYTSEQYRLERGIVDAVRARLHEQGQTERAEEITMGYLGWPE